MTDEVIRTVLFIYNLITQRVLLLIACDLKDQQSFNVIVYNKLNENL